MKIASNRLAALVAAGAMALTMAACGSDDAPEVVEPTSSGAPATEEPGAQEPAAEEPADVQAGEEISPEDFMNRLKSPGAERLGSFAVQMDMSGEGDGFTMNGVADLRGEQPQMQFTMEMPGVGLIDVIMIEGEVFMGMPGITEEGQYMRIDPAELGLDLGELTGAMDMDEMFDSWDQGAQTVTFVGTEEVDGEQLDHFTLAVDASVAAESMGQTMAPGMPDAVSYDVWLDSENLMRKVSFDLQGVIAELHVDNWGEDVGIEAPAESDIIDFSF